MREDGGPVNDNRLSYYSKADDFLADSLSRVSSALTAAKSYSLISLIGL